jgi:hypothetical protein
MIISRRRGWIDPHESLDVARTADQDEPDRFGLVPRRRTPGPSSTREYARLRILDPFQHCRDTSERYPAA